MDFTDLRPTVGFDIGGTHVSPTTGKLRSPIRRDTRSTGQPSASAEIWVRTVQAPVPMSAAPMDTV